MMKTYHTTDDDRMVENVVVFKILVTFITLS